MKEICEVNQPKADFSKTVSTQFWNKVYHFGKRTGFLDQGIC